MRRSLVFFVYLLFPVGFAIADPASVAAALKDEASECRYLVRMCRDHRATLTHMTNLRKETEATLPSDEEILKMTAQEREDFLSKIEDQKRNLIVVADKLLKESVQISEAMQVIRAKHETMPTCFEQCSDVVDLKSFK